MRIFIFTKTQLSSFRSIGAQFINHHIFPKLAFTLLQKPRHSGGLGVLDPTVQQKALQWRWICPILLTSCAPDLVSKYAVPSFPFLFYIFQWFFFLPYTA